MVGFSHMSHRLLHPTGKARQVSQLKSVCTHSFLNIPFLLACHNFCGAGGRGRCSCRSSLAGFLLSWLLGHLRRGGGAASGRNFGNYLRLGTAGLPAGFNRGISWEAGLPRRIGPIRRYRSLALAGAHSNARRSPANPSSRR